MEPLNLYEYVLTCLRSRAIPQRQVAGESGVPFSTVAKIAQCTVKEPSVHTVQKLADYFVSKGIHPHQEPPPAPSRLRPLPASGQGANTASPTAAAESMSAAPGQGGGAGTEREEEVA